MMRDEEYFAIKKRAAAALRTNPDVVAVGVGGRERGGQPTGEIVIKVFVRRKKPASEVPPERMIPLSFEGVPTDVDQMGIPRPAFGAVEPHKTPVDHSRTDPLRGGMTISIEGEPKGSNGTLGCMLLDNADATAIYGLTNQHVIVGDRLSLSRRVIQTAADGSGLDGANPVGYVTVAANDATRDVALIRLEPEQKWLPAIKEIGFVRGKHDVTVLQAATQTYPVKKFGARTGLTTGVVVSLGTESVKLPHQLKFDMVIRPDGPPPRVPPLPDSTLTFFISQGDSGSAVVNEDDKIIGLLWGEATGLATEIFDPDGTRSLAFATPIGVVLDRFKQVEKLDLTVAATTDPNATEATTTLPVPHPAGAPLIAANQVIAKADQRYDRPLSGGLQITAHPFLGVLVSGTLGAVVVDTSNPGSAHILTSYAGLSANGTTPPALDNDVGQPDNDDSCTGCCSNTVGGFFKGGPDHATPTAALVKLKDDQRWLAEIMQIGLIDGTASVTAADVDTGLYLVRKRGIATRLTGGVVTAVGGVRGTIPAGVRPEAMIIRPNPNPSKPTEGICFSHFLDRGALVVNWFNKVVGLLYDEIEIVESGRKVVHGVATPIHIVLDQLKNSAGVDVQMAKAEKPDQVQTAIARQAMPPEAAMPPVAETPQPRREPIPGFAAPLPVPAGAFARLREELSRTPTGAFAMSMWLRHGREIRDLIDHNRRVATVWHRSGGPALLQALVRAVHVPSAIVPATINGVPIAEGIDRVAHVFRKYGSPDLQEDVAQLQSQLPPIGGLSLDEILAAVQRP